jgi:hypothetical protein
MKKRNLISAEFKSKIVLEVLHFMYAASSQHERLLRKALVIIRILPKQVHVKWLS